MSISEIPSELLAYFHNFIEIMESISKMTLYRYISPPESALWVGYGGYDLSKISVPKMSTTIFPVLNGVGIFYRKSIFISLGPYVYDYALAVSYTHWNDPITQDVLCPHEFELAIYSCNRTMAQRCLDFVDISSIEMARFIRNAELVDADYRKSKALLIYLYNRVYSRYNYTLVPNYALVKYLAMQLVTLYDKKMRYAFAVAWDKYWDDRGKLAAKPKYGEAVSRYIASDFRSDYSQSNLESTCGHSFIPEKKCKEVEPLVVQELKEIYGLIGHEIKYSAYVPVAEKPHLPDTSIKWWYGTKEDLDRYLREIRMYEIMGVPKYPPHILDPDIVVEDGWEL